MTTYIRPYNMRSEGANKLAEEMGVTLILEGRAVRRGDTIINWGTGGLGDNWPGARILNKGSAVSIAINKVSTFKALEKANVPHPEWTSSYDEAKAVFDKGHPVIVRTELEGKDGAGLILAKPGVVKQAGWFNQKEVKADLPKGQIYTQFIKAKSEYRINVCNDSTVGVQLKVKANDADKILDEDIKTGSNGYGFKLLEENDIPHGIRPVARAAIAACGLDFGGVDLIVGEDGKPYVLEVNTAPELTPAMVRGYAAKLRAMI